MASVRKTMQTFRRANAGNLEMIKTLEALEQCLWAVFDGYEDARGEPTTALRDGIRALILAWLVENTLTFEFTAADLATMQRLIETNKKPVEIQHVG